MFSFLAGTQGLSECYSRTFEICPLRELKPPAWYITLVLRSLTCLPYKPSTLFLDRHLTLKMCFLLAPASAKNVSELHSMYKCQTCALVNFLPPLSRTLKDYVDRGREMLLPPVRAVKQHLSRMDQYHPGCSNLFISTGRLKDCMNNIFFFFFQKYLT